MALNKNKSILCIFIDFRKVFETVQPSILLDKMHYYGIRGCIYNWFSSYLGRRTYYSVFNNIPSQTEPIHLEVPQGSILGPILSFIYINDISNISDSHTHKKADNSNLYIIKEGIDQLKLSIDQLLNYRNSLTCIQQSDLIHILSTYITFIFYTRKSPE